MSANTPPVVSDPNIGQASSNVANLVQNSIDSALAEAFSSVLHIKNPGQTRFIGYVILDTVNKNIVFPKNNPKDFIGLRQRGFYNKFLEITLASCKAVNNPLIAGLSDDEIKKKIKERFIIHNFTTKSNLINVDVNTESKEKEFDEKKGKLISYIDFYNEHTDRLNNAKTQIASVATGLRNCLAEYDCELPESGAKIFRDKIHQYITELSRVYHVEKISQIK